jgi:hypothetical protein
VPVLTEQDYYRAEIEQVEAFAPLVPIDRVWVEHVGGDSGGMLGNLDAPARRGPLVVTAAGRAMGRRVVQAVADGFIRDLRAVTEIYSNDKGRDCIRVCSEVEWYQWGFAGKAPATVECGVEMLWLE